MKGRVARRALAVGARSASCAAPVVAVLVLAVAVAEAGGDKVASAAAAPASCPAGMVRIPGGADGGSSNGGGDFCLDRTEVTLGAYRACVAAKKCEPLSTHIDAPRLGLSGRDAKIASKRCTGRKKKGSATLPVNCVDHDEAATFCGFLGRRLPTDGEWAWAAQGGAEARPFPWGAQAPGRRACWNGKGNAAGKGRRRKPCAVGKHKKGVSAQGLHDLAGNLWEWTATESGKGFTIRGGSWSDDNDEDLRTSRRGLAEAREKLDILGFRCALDLGGPASAASGAGSGSDAKGDDDRPEEEIPLKKAIVLPARPTPPYCVGASPECPPCMALVKGGSFRLGGKEGPLVRVADFCMDLTEVTVRRYSDCVGQGGCLWPVTQMCRSNPLAAVDHPMNCVTWRYARTYCAAIGKALPTEEQWEWAARGGDEARQFPWGNEAPEAQLCWRRAKEEDPLPVDLAAEGKVVQVEASTSGAGATPASASAAPKPGSVDEGTCVVGSHLGGVSAHGLHDLAGNVWEWTRTKDASDPRARILRGGSWENTDKIHVSALGRLSLVALSASRKIGFRCVSTPGQPAPPASPAAPPTAAPAPVAAPPAK